MHVLGHGSECSDRSPIRVSMTPCALHIRGSSDGWGTGSLVTRTMYYNVHLIQNVQNDQHIQAALQDSHTKCRAVWMLTPDSRWPSKEAREKGRISLVAKSDWPHADYHVQESPEDAMGDGGWTEHDRQHQESLDSGCRRSKWRLRKCPSSFQKTRKMQSLVRCCRGLVDGGIVSMHWDRRVLGLEGMDNWLEGTGQRPVIFIVKLTCTKSKEVYCKMLLCNDIETIFEPCHQKWSIVERPQNSLVAQATWVSSWGCRA